MPNFNKVIIAGHLTRNPQLSYMPNQTAVVDFGMATNHRWKSQDGNEREEVCFVDCLAYGNRAETINKWCDKGKPLLIEGRLKLETWNTEDGQKRQKHKIVVEGFVFLDSAKTTEPDDNIPFA